MPAARRSPSDVRRIRQLILQATRVMAITLACAALLSLVPYAVRGSPPDLIVSAVPIALACWLSKKFWPIAGTLCVGSALLTLLPLLLGGPAFPLALGGLFGAVVGVNLRGYRTLDTRSVTSQLQLCLIYGVVSAYFSSLILGWSPHHLLVAIVACVAVSLPAVFHSRIEAYLRVAPSPATDNPSSAP